ncbi:MAG: hypothetical protein ABIG90_03395 [bacterium]
MNDLENYEIGSHALIRFKQRWKRVHGRKPKKARKKIRQLLCDAQEMENPAQYDKKYEIEDWVFVFDTSLKKLKTVLRK